MSNREQHDEESSARQRISRAVETLSLTEPLLFAAWTMHDVMESTQIATMRVGCGKIEFNPKFIGSLQHEQLREVISFESMRILLGHPYARRQDRAELSWQASNLAVQECMRTTLPIERPRDVFESDQFDHQYFEFYYQELAARSSENPNEQTGDNAAADERAANENSMPPGLGEQPGACEGESSSETVDQHGDTANDEASAESLGAESPSAGAPESSLDAYSDATQTGLQNTMTWAEDELYQDEIDAAVREAAESSGWGSLAGRAKEQLQATLLPRLDYRRVLRNFRQSMLSVSRSLTRMKPSRRYGFDQMGSRYQFTTKLLLAVDVSGSMSKRDLETGFSLIRRFFNHGVEQIDVIWFDEQLKSEAAIPLRRARATYNVTGRGGTSFQPVIEFVDQETKYDGCIVYTDGYAPVPSRPKNRRTKILWLFKDQATYQSMDRGFREIGSAVYLQPSGNQLATMSR
ncbi:MAG: VWA-like domain-containing protein [Planctomycetota bacterium]